LAMVASFKRPFSTMTTTRDVKPFFCYLFSIQHASPSPTPRLPAAVPKRATSLALSLSTPRPPPPHSHLLRGDRADLCEERKADRGGQERVAARVERFVGGADGGIRCPRRLRHVAARSLRLRALGGQHGYPDGPVRYGSRQLLLQEERKGHRRGYMYRQAKSSCEVTRHSFDHLASTRRSYKGYSRLRTRTTLGHCGRSIPRGIGPS